ncbi:hypothetical protein IU449_05635 [Nocardia higoensis]|uniref:Uncharacterized protein n=1 Tax=Nocardia higoensis TaxID=228599 RepID=A0ABS0D6D6_9NOCA|nr:hypothetical protein [Nocardia higoensis]MBF6354037.1 hypothetical protein [Nocardia higoensis]
MTDKSSGSENALMPSIVGVVTGGILAVIVYFPAVAWLQNVFDVPELTPVPKKYRGESEPISMWYWATWMIPILVVIPIGLALSFWRQLRVFALVSTVVFVLGSAAVAAMVISFETNGFAPD